MGRSGHIAEIRSRIGTRLLLMPSVAAAVIDDDRRVLVLRHLHDDRWGLPGGAMEPGETPAQAAMRELREETGLTGTPEAIIGVCGGSDHVLHYPNGDRTAYVTTIFAVRWDGGEVVPDGTEVDAARWITARERGTLAMDSSTRELIAVTFAWLAASADGDRAARFR